MDGIISDNWGNKIGIKVWEYKNLHGRYGHLHGFLDRSENTDLGKGEAEGDRKINGDWKEYSYLYGTNNICINIRKYCSINIVLMIRES